jgi:hypothetical protein
MPHPKHLLVLDAPKEKAPGPPRLKDLVAVWRVAQTITMLIQCGSGAIEPGGVDLKVQASDLMGAEAVAAIV